MGVAHNFQKKMNCHYCNDELKLPYAKYGDTLLCGFCSSQVEHQDMVTRGSAVLQAEKLGDIYILNNEIETLEFTSIHYFEYWKKLYSNFIKLVRLWFTDDVGYLWTGETSVEKIPGPLKVRRYHRKVFGCMYTIDAPQRRDYQPGDEVVFQVEGSRKKIPGVIQRYSDKLRMYAVQPTNRRAFLAPEKYLTRIDTTRRTHYPDAEVIIDGVLAWRGYTGRKPASAHRIAARYDPRLRGIAQRYVRITLFKVYKWYGTEIVVNKVGVPKDYLTDTSEIDTSGTSV